MEPGAYGAMSIAPSASRATTKMKVGSATKGTKRKVDCAPKRKAGSIAKSKAGVTATRKSGLSGSECSVKRARTGKALAAFTMMETDEQHALRHPKLDLACLRCAFAKYGRYWQRLAGQGCWLSPRPAYMGGPWGLGCLNCAAKLQQRSKKRSRAGWVWKSCRASKWAKFRVTEFKDYKATKRTIKRHKESLLHQRASRHTTPHSAGRSVGTATSSRAGDFEPECRITRLR